jgi:hypothetical protein
MAIVRSCGPGEGAAAAARREASMHSEVRAEVGADLRAEVAEAEAEVGSPRSPLLLGPCL